MSQSRTMHTALQSALLLLLTLLYGHIGLASAGQFVHLTGHYSDEDLAKGAAPKLLPMTFLYDANNNLVPADHWVAALAEVKKHIGNGYCCVSEKKPEKEGEPPADCVRAVFGTDIAANFNGLKDSSGNPIRMRDVPQVATGCIRGQLVCAVLKGGQSLDCLF